MKKTGILGGTFDPIHNGHLIIAEYLKDALDLEEVWFIPAKIHPLKENEEISSSKARLEMLQQATSDNPHFKVNDIELRKEGISYTVETLRQLKKTYQKYSPEFYFFIGMDNVNDLTKWKEPEEILDLCQVVAFGRPGFQPVEEVKKYLSRIKIIHVPLLEISSTMIRNRIREEHSVRYLVPDPVFRYIRKNHLYRSA